jgi:hypothetical protein
VDRGREPEYRPLLVVFAVRDFLALFEHVFFGLVVGNFFWRGGLLTILGVVVGVFVVGVLVLGVAVDAGWHACESCLQVPATQTSSPRRCRAVGGRQKSRLLGRPGGLARPSPGKAGWTG